VNSAIHIHGSVLKKRRGKLYHYILVVNFDNEYISWLYEVS